MTRTTRAFSAVKTEGGLLPQDLLSRIQSGDPELPGTSAKSYNLAANERIGEAANRAWSRLVTIWHAFQEALEKESEDSPATGLTRERWLLPLFQELGYGRLPKGAAMEVEGKSFAISHTWNHSPIHLLGCRVDLDRRQKGVAGAAKSSPHGLVQEFLNRSDDHLWGLVTNGYRIRVLRDHHSLTRQSYVEFDLQTILDGEQYSEFLLFWLVCHQSRVEAEQPEDCWLEAWVNTSRDEGVRALDKLRGGVEKAIEALGTGFLSHPKNTALRESLESGSLDKQDYYRQLLRLVYRLIFLFVAEERDALLDLSATEEARERYRRWYDTHRLRVLAEKRRGSPHGDVWRALALVMEKLYGGYPELGLPALGSRLWGPAACPTLMPAECANEHMLTAIRQLSHIQEGTTRYPVNWRNIGADELGSIYEGLLELHPRVSREAGTFSLDTAAGHERKTTGSYYTPTSLVDCLLESALDPMLDEACTKPNPEQSVLDLKVCDPACGSGHFLVAAARRIAKRLASLRSGDDEPSPIDVQKALRDVVGHCIYGVDLNPMAVELCKVSLWMEAIEPGKPLSFLDSHIQCGNALLGTTPALMSLGIPEAAFKSLEGDDREVVKRLTKRNREERKTGQATMFGMFAGGRDPDYNVVVDQAVSVETVPDDTIAAVQKKESDWDKLARSTEFKGVWLRADAWCSAFVWPKREGDLEHAAITHGTWRRIEKDVSEVGHVAETAVQDLSGAYRFFHWHLAFPHVFSGPKSGSDATNSTGWSGGFDVVLGNPPWETLEFKEKEWFSSTRPEISEAPSTAKRRSLIVALEEEDEPLFQQYKAALRHSEGIRALVRNTGRFPLCAVGKINTYSLFAELNRQVIQRQGRVGCVVQSGIASDDTTKGFFRDLMETRTLVSLFDFENSEGLFPGVHREMKFSLLTMSGSAPIEVTGSLFAFFQTSLRDIETSTFVLTADDIERMNPNTRTCPILRTHADADLAKKIYSRLPVLSNEAEDAEQSGWQVSFSQGLFNMSSASGRFVDLAVYRELSSDKRRQCLPIYEGKLTEQFNHRYATFDSVAADDVSKGNAREATRDELCAPGFVSTPRYYLGRDFLDEVDPIRSSHFLTFHRVANPNNERSSVFAILPRYGITDSLFLVRGLSAAGALMFSAMGNSFAFDYITRLKVGSRNFSFFTIKQIAVPHLSAVSKGYGAFIVDRSLELTYTANDLEAFAHECDLRALPFRWQSPRRLFMCCELDAAFFHLYLGSPKEWRDGSSPEVLTRFPTPRDAVIYIMETFPIVKRRDEAEYGDYRTKLQILDVYDEMQRAMDRGELYQTPLDPPPADPRVAHSDTTRSDCASVDG